MRPAHVTLAVGLQRGVGRLVGSALAAGAEALPRELGLFWVATSSPGETLELLIRGHLAEKVDVRELAHLEQRLETLSDPNRNPLEWELATAYLGLVPADLDPAVPEDTRWHPVSMAVPARRYTHRFLGLAGRASGCPAGQALVHEHRLRARAAGLHDLGAARGRTSPLSGHEVSATNLQRVLLRARRARAHGRPP